MTAPLTPPECDLRDFQFLPLDVVRLRDSDMMAAENAEVFRAAVMSWCVAWHQLPAGSLPDDDFVLARLLGYGRDLAAWRALRGAGALRGYVKCDDGRLYHPVVAEKALSAWTAKKAQRDRTEKARLAKQTQPRASATPVTEPVTEPVTAHVTEPVTTPVTDTVTGSKGEGQCKGQGEGESSLRSEVSAREPVVKAEKADQLDLPDFLDRRPEARVIPFEAGEDEDMPDDDVPTAEDRDKAMTAYNRTVDYVNRQHAAGWSACSALNPTRDKKLNARLKQAGGLRGWCDQMARAARSKHLLGLTRRSPGFENWRPDFDFFLQLKSFTKLMEGGYDDAPGKTGGSGGTTAGESAARAAAAYG